MTTDASTECMQQTHKNPYRLRVKKLMRMITTAPKSQYSIYPCFNVLDLLETVDMFTIQEFSNKGKTNLVGKPNGRSYQEYGNHDLSSHHMWNISVSVFR